MSAFRIYTKPPVLGWMIQKPEVFNVRLEPPFPKWQIQRPQTTEAEGAW